MSLYVRLPLLKEEWRNSSLTNGDRRSWSPTLLAMCNSFCVSPLRVREGLLGNLYLSRESYDFRVLTGFGPWMLCGHGSFTNRKAERAE